MMKKLLLFFIILISFDACISFNVKGTKSAKKLYEEFFLGQGVMQYFVKPLEFKNDEYSFTIDFTFRDTLSDVSLVISNFSVFLDDKSEIFDSIGFESENFKVDFINPTQLYIDFNKKQYIKRFTSYVKYGDMKNFFYSENLSIFIYSKNVKKNLYPTKKTSKNMNILNNKLFEITELNQF
jgi:hypothetical protein